ncbi:MAG: serine/threonine-protein kinase [Myxococcota bacterium]
MDIDEPTTAPLSTEAEHPGPSGTPQGPSDLDAEAVRAAVFRDLFPRRFDRVLLGRYTLLHKLGEGGMGVVYAAYDDVLDRKVAVKFIHTRQAHRSTAQARLLREARAMARVSHPAVVTVFDAGRTDEHVFIAMEFVEGRSLSKWMEEGSHPWRDALSLFIAAGRGLAAAHGNGVVHRDFKPGNVLIDSHGRAKVADFGLAGLEAGEPRPIESTKNSEAESALTRTGAVMGTPAYMAPEQFAGEAATPASDQFSFCVALFEALFGARPFDGQSLRALEANVKAGRLLSPLPPAEVPTRLKDIVMRGLSSSPSERFESMEQLVAALEQSRRGRWQRPSTVGLAGVGLGSLALLGGLALQEPTTSPCSGGRQQLEGVWDPEQRQRMVDALSAVDRPYAEGTATGVAEGLSTYADAWVAGFEDACLATRVRGESSETLLDRRMGCLQGRRRELSALVDVLAEPDPRVLRGAVEAVESLPAVQRCDDIDYVLAEVPPPGAERAPAITAAEVEISEVRARRRAGLYDAAATKSAKVLEQARTLEYRPLVAAALVEHAAVLEGQGNYAEAREHYQRAYAVADEVGADEHRLDAALGVVTVTAQHLRETDALQPWDALAPAAWRRIGEPPLREADLRLALGTGSYLRGNLDDAIEQLRRALEVVMRTRGSGLHAARVRGQLGTVLSDNSEREAAEVQLRQALDIRLAEQGPDHPDVAAAHRELGTLLMLGDDPAPAAASLREALRIQLEALGSEHPEVAITRNQLGRVLQLQGELEAALSELRKAQQIAGQSLGGEHLVVGRLHKDMGSVLIEMGRIEEGLDEHRRSLEHMRAAFGPEHRAPVIVQLSFGQALAAHGRHAEALQELGEARDVARSGLGPDDMLLGFILHGIGRSHEATGQLQQAGDAYREALRVRRAVEPSDPAAIAQSRAFLAHTMARSGRGEEALEHAEAAMAYLDDPDIGPMARVAKAEARLGMGRESDDALAVLREVRAATKDPWLRARIDESLAGPPPQ